jgi:hypothetical protein
MDSFSNILAVLSASKAYDESSPTSSTPVEEESQSSSGGCYCVIAWTRCIPSHSYADVSGDGCSICEIIAYRRWLQLQDTAP